MDVDAPTLIKSFNAGRDPQRLAMKYQKMRASTFAFLRATCHLFYQRLAAQERLKDAPLVWACGDLHLENFGSYKGSNGQVYFDLNDFDEAALAPANWDLVRMVASIEIGALDAGIKPKRAAALCQAFVQTYAEALSLGKSYWLERETATGPIHHLLSDLRERKRNAFLDTRTDARGGKRAIRLDGKKALPASAQERKHVKALISSYASTQPAPGFYRVLDVARRIAGTGSLGLERYMVLVQGKGGVDGNYLLDLKRAVPSSLTPYLKTKQPRWPCEGQRVVALQQRIQAVPMAFLHSIEDAKASYVLRALQPSEDRIRISESTLAPDGQEDLIHAMGQMVAWAHLRTCARQGSASADELIAFGHRKAWRSPLLASAQRCARQVREDAVLFNQAYDHGEFDVHSS
jgi:uncharacterized protein (DUF2252 family)